MSNSLPTYFLVFGMPENKPGEFSLRAVDNKCHPSSSLSRNALALLDASNDYSRHTGRRSFFLNDVNRHIRERGELWTWRGQRIDWEKAREELVWGGSTLSFSMDVTELSYIVACQIAVEKIWLSTTSADRSISNSEKDALRQLVHNCVVDGWTEYAEYAF